MLKLVKTKIPEKSTVVYIDNFSNIDSLQMWHKLWHDLLIAKINKVYIGFIKLPVNWETRDFGQLRRGILEHPEHIQINLINTGPMRALLYRLEKFGDILC